MNGPLGRSFLMAGPAERHEVLHQLDRDPWWCGPVGWLLGNVVALPEPVPCRGWQKLWRLPSSVEAAVLAQLRDVVSR